MLHHHVSRVNVISIELALTGTEGGGGLVGSVAAMIHAVAEEIRLDAEFILSAPEVLAGVLCETTREFSFVTFVLRSSSDRRIRFQAA